MSIAEPAEQSDHGAIIFKKLRVVKKYGIVTLDLGKEKKGKLVNTLKGVYLKGC